MIKGRVFKFGDNIDTDAIIPAIYLNITAPDELAKHCMSGIDKEFAKNIKKGDIIVAGKNFGCGSSREHAPISIKAKGVSCIIAGSFARIFYRNAFNIALPVLVCEEASKNINNGDIITVNINTGIIKNLTGNQVYKALSIPEFMQRLIKVGGLLKYAKEKSITALKH